MIDSVTYGNEFYRDTITICNDTVNYKVTTSNTNCISESSIDGDKFSDVLPPKPPTIKSVSVDTSNNLVNISWSKGYPEDTEAYIILKLMGGSWVPIDTVYGINNITYSNINSRATNESECYGIAAFDSCRYGNPLSANTSPMSISHCTIFLETQHDMCNQTITLNWNNYSTWRSGVLNYEVFYNENGGNFISHSIVTGNTQSINNINPNSLYCFFVKAVSINLLDTSFSNQTCIFTTYPFISDTNYLQNVSVTAETQIEVKIYTPSHNTINGYKINRSEDGVSFNEIGSITKTPNPIIYIDNNVTPSSNSYIYNVVPFDSCNNVTNKISNIGGNILLVVDDQGGSYLNKLSWKPYLNWNGGVTNYNIYRVLGNNAPILITTVASNIFEYEDDISLFFASSSDGKFCYYIEAQEATNQFGISEISKSNIVCTKPQEIIYIPNSFTPDNNGLNDIFKPIIGFANYNKYSLKIFNRLGQVIFETDNINLGWDGKYKGILLLNEVLIYEVLIETTEGRPIKKTGHLTIF